MKKKLLGVLCFLGSVGVSSVSFANMNGFSWPGLDNFELYVGVDFQKRTMEFAKEYGSKLFKKDSLQGNLFGGLKFNKYFGV